MGSAEGARATAARRIGLSLDEYDARIASGEKWCGRCRVWHPVSAFGRDRSRADGMASACRRKRGELARTSYVRRPRPAPGRRFVAPRDGDKLQARRRVNHLVDVGLLPAPGDVACADCGHLGPDRRHEYDHHLGYDAEHHEDVQAVCSPCHHKREALRRANEDRVGPQP